MDLSKAKLGAYDHERGIRTLYVPCAESDDPRETFGKRMVDGMIDAVQGKPAPKPKAKRKPAKPKADK